MPIILAADSLRAGFCSSTDGRNVGFHEFAHVLDFGDGYFDGVPAHMDWQSVRPWVDLMTKELSKADSRRARKLVRSYGYTNEAEFFACATEMFFEQPRQIQRRAPELYQLLVSFYGQDLLAEPREDPKG